MGSIIPARVQQFILRGSRRQVRIYPKGTRIESNNYDASLEYYFSPTGFVSATIFRRDLDGFIQDLTLPDFIDPVVFGPNPVRLTAPVNTRKGRIDEAHHQSRVPASNNNHIFRRG